MAARLRRTLFCCAVVVLSSARQIPLAAQVLPEPPAGTRAGPTPASTGGMVAGALLGAAVGLVAGIPVGNAIDRSRGYDSSCRECTRWGAAGGAGAGVTIGIATGVHVVNGARGRLLPVLGRTALTIAAGWGLSFAAYKAGGEGWDMVGLLAAVGVATGVAIHTERATMPHPLPAPPAKAAPSSGI